MILDFIFESFARASARYRAYLDAENAKVRAQAQAAAYQRMSEQLGEDYYIVAELIHEAVNNTAGATHLQPITHISQLFTDPWFRITSDGSWVFRYSLRRDTSFDLTAEDIRRILQSELDRLCGIHGLPRVKIRVRFRSYGSVELLVTPAVII